MAVVKSFARVRTLLSSNMGFWSWLTLASVLVWEHKDALREAIQTGAVKPVVVSYALQLGESIQTVISVLQQVPMAHGWEYLTLLITAVGAAAHVLWYFKAGYIVAAWFDPDVSPLLVWGLIGMNYFAIVFAVTGWLPDVGTLKALTNVLELVQFERLNPLMDPGNATNLTNSTT
ncbi:hypothetical protein [Haloplanus natans]|uniref:hypothetical protein n=1 Tax=Haloplanus natans TaxID=376171 RepID=UPI0012FA72D8|nr:hypothetical protein [Haloplanus natans]